MYPHVQHDVIGGNKRIFARGAGLKHRISKDSRLWWNFPSELPWWLAAQGEPTGGSVSHHMRLEHQKYVIEIA
jgi:hypothetical protein